MESDLKLDKAVQYCRAKEESSKHVKLMQDEFIKASHSEIVQDELAVNKIRKYNNAQKSVLNKCSKCLTNHAYKSCPAWGKVCNKCKKLNHFAKACKAKELNVVNFEENENVEQVKEEADILTIKSVFTLHSKQTEWNHVFLINDIEVSFKLDSGADVNVLPLNVFNQLTKSYDLTPTKRFLKSYSGHRINVIGTCVLECKPVDCISQSYMIEFYVVKESSCPILGLITCQELKLIFRINAIGLSSNGVFNEFKDVFDGTLGKLPVLYDITLKDDAKSQITSPRPIPKALTEIVKNEIENMLKEGVLEEVKEPTDWVHPIVIVKKPNGKIRICIDPRTLNKCIKREHYSMPTTQGILSKLDGAKYFSVLDASSAFLQIPLTKASSYLCTVATPFGRYRFCRLPFGLNSAPEVFQRAIDGVILGLDGVVSYMDDVLVFGKTKQEHDDRLRAFLEKARSNNLKLSKDKSQIGVQTVTYLGHTISSEGVKIVDSKVEAIQKYPTPKNKSDVQRFLGMVTYLGKFVPNMSDKTGVLRKLISKKNEFKWSDEEQQCFEFLKECVTKAPVLSFFDDSKRSVLSVDASQYGLGAVVLQSGQPIGYSSVSLTDTQKRYSQIEKELLAVVNGCKKFHYYLFGTEFTVETDHKPLIGLLSKPISSLSPRLQRMVMDLMRYNFTMVHVPGKDMFVADSLSRAPIDDKINTDYLEKGAQVIYSLVSASDEILERIKLSVQTDTELKKVMGYIRNGWPVHRKNVDVEARPYWDKRTELHTAEDLVFVGDRMVIPSKMRHEILAQLHSSHQGINSCQRKAKLCIYWPRIMSDVKNMIDQCAVCQSYQRSNVKQPLKPYPVPHLPWEELGIDFFHVENANHLLVVDYHSKFIEVRKLNNTNAEHVINSLTQIFRTHGLPHVIHSDNGPPFDSSSFRSFASRFHFKHVTSSPLYPKSNGMVERAIQTIKSMLIKTKMSKGDLNLAIVEYNNTPKENGKAPSQMLFGRLLRTVLPVHNNILKPLYPIEDTIQKLGNQQEQQKKYYDRSSRSLKDLSEGECIYMQKGLRNWVPGVVMRRLENPDSYVVKTKDGIYRRNRVHLRPRKENTKEDDKKNENDQPEEVYTHPKRQRKMPTRFNDYV